MVKAKIVKQIIVTTSNEVGTLGKISTALMGSGLNILHLCGSAISEDASFIIVVSDPEAAVKILQKMEYEVSVSDVLEVEFDSAAGTLSPAAQKLGDAGVDIKYIFGTTGNGSKIVGIISTNDNQKAVNLLNE